MIKITNITHTGFEPAIRGMRNSWNSWDKDDIQDLINWDEVWDEIFDAYKY